MIVDRQGRRFRNLRVSLTAACNYACTYCVPDGKRLVAAQDELSADALARGVAYLIEAAGIERLRITGGEPLVSPRLDAFLAAVAKLDLDDVSLTTNGQLLARKLPQLQAAGIRRLNVSSTPSTRWLSARLPVAATWALCWTQWSRPAPWVCESRSIWCRCAGKP